MKIAVVGLNHQTAPVSLREQAAFDDGRIPEHLVELSALDAVTEGALLSTCNRVEVYVAAPDPQTGAEAAAAWLAATHGLDPAKLRPHLYTHVEADAVRHGFRVAASLDSLVVGEPQILGQMKQAYQQAAEAGATGPVLNRFFHQAFRVAKRVRTETAIAENAVSVSFAAVALARKIFGALDGKSCLLIGAGQMCELAARHLVGNGVGEVLVTNRTLERAAALAEAFNGHAFPLEALADTLDRADIVISSTGSTTYLVDAPMVRAALKRRRQRPMFFIDIAVPRDLDPRIGEVDSAFLYDMDDLQKVVEANRAQRQTASLEADRLIDQETRAFVRWLTALEAVPTIVALRRRAERLRDAEVARLLEGWPEATPAERRRVEELARLLVNKLLHDPVSSLRELAGRRDGQRYVEAARLLFKIEGFP